jgi:hypothetical protein
MKFGAKRDPPASTVGFFFAPNFIQNLYTVLKKRLWESRSTPTLVKRFSRPLLTFDIPQTALVATLDT